MLGEALGAVEVVTFDYPCEFSDFFLNNFNYAI